MKLFATSISILAIALLGLFLISTNKKPVVKLSCVLTTEKTTYTIGELPQLKVIITNESKDDVVLIGSIDGSDAKMRYPYCYYSIEKPQLDTIRPFARCGNMNGLVKSYFVKLKSSESFEPLGKYKRMTFFPSPDLTRKDNFRKPGKYKFQFHYSTDTDDFTKYMGDGEVTSELEDLLKKVPKVNLESNILEIEFK